MQWIDVVQTAGIVASILIALWQMRVQARQTTAATDTALADTVHQINLLLFEHPEIFPEFDKPFPTHESGQVGDRRYHLMQLILNTFERAFQQHRYGFVDRAAWQSWIRTMNEIMSKPYAQGHWQAIRNLHTVEFQKLVDDLRRGQ